MAQLSELRRLELFGQAYTASSLSAISKLSSSLESLRMGNTAVPPCLSRLTKLQMLAVFDYFDDALPALPYLSKLTCCKGGLCRASRRQLPACRSCSACACWAATSAAPCRPGPGWTTFDGLEHRGHCLRRALVRWQQRATWSTFLQSPCLHLSLSTSVVLGRSAGPHSGILLLNTRRCAA